MKPSLKVWIYYIIIAGIVLVLNQWMPVTINLSQLNWETNHESIITSADTIELLPAHPPLFDTLPVRDTLSKPVQKDSIPRDTILKQSYLSAKPAFFSDLKVLYQKLATAKDRGKIIRILHIGDSQIEGDRITRYLRENFQEQFGGSGPGLTTIYDPSRMNPSIWLNNAGDWHIRSVFDRKHHLADKTYGVMGVVAELSKKEKGSVKISRSPWAEPHAANYQKIRLFVAPHLDTLRIMGDIKKTVVINDTLLPSNALTEINWEFTQLSPTLKMNFESNDAVRILGCALDSTAGIAMDNIALRGQSTPLLHRTDGEVFEAMAEHLNVGMIIFQFGTNMIPTVANNYSFYKKMLSRQFHLLKTYLPNIPVLVIGIADAAHLDEGELKTYDHLTKIRDAQKQVTLEHDFAFFDLYEAMGGKGSIIKWANADPPRALSDYIHFTKLGGKEAAKLIWSPLREQFTEFDNYPIPSLDVTRLSDSLQWNK
ncbi:MAG: hypothetical protein JEZ14_12820 [Marinilabiliaceae bacterium]|nr:hypothetical protein [Marinilabiliaceae bacterium]